MVCGFIKAICGALLSSIYGLISGLNGYSFAPVTGTYTTDNNGFIDNDTKMKYNILKNENEIMLNENDDVLLNTLFGLQVYQLYILFGLQSPAPRRQTKSKVSAKAERLAPDTIENQK